jgi:hypothetical protein
MGFKVKVKTGTPLYNVTVYTRAGNGLSTAEYNVYYGPDGSSWNYLAGPLNSTSCTQLSTIDTTLGPTIYFKLERDIGATDVFFNYATSQFCPSNQGVTCVWSVTPSSNMDVALTAYVIGGDLVDC